MKIIIGSMMHESNTFSCVPTDVDAFKRTQYLIGEDLVKFHSGKRTELGGILQVFKKNEVDVIPAISATAMPSDVVTKDTYSEIKNIFISTVRDSINEIDGVLLALHGAMIVEDLEDPEGDLLSEIRRILPEGKYVAASLDHHAHLTDTMVENTDFLVGYRTHPHVDLYETGEIAAQIMLRLIKEKLNLTKAYIWIPLMVTGENNDEARGKLIAELEKIDNDQKVITSSIFIGHPWCDISIAGDSVLVITNNDQEGADRYARNLANKFWGLRHDFPLDLYSVQQAVKMGLEPNRKGPTVLCEMGDCLMGGGSGDVVTTLSYLIQRGVKGVAVAVVVDSESVDKATKAGVGTTVKLNVGGKLCREGNPPLSFEGKVKFLGRDAKEQDSSLNAGWETSMGRIAVVEGCGVEIVIVERPGKAQNPSFLESLGIKPEEKKFIVLKDSIGPQITYKNIADRVFLVDTPGWCNPMLYTIDYKKVPRPIFPLDPAMSWTAK